MIVNELIRNEIGNKKKIALGLAWNWFAHRLAVLALRLALAFHFFPLPTTGKLLRANHAPQAPQPCPACSGSRTSPRHLGNGCRFARINVPVGLQATIQAMTQ